MDDTILEFIKSDITEIKRSVLDTNKKLDKMEAKFVTKEVFDILKHTVIGMVIGLLGYLGFDISK